MKWRSFGQNILELKDANISHAWISMKHTFTRTKQEMGAEFVMFSFDMLICSDRHSQQVAYQDLLMLFSIWTQVLYKKTVWSVRWSLQIRSLFFMVTIPGWSCFLDTLKELMEPRHFLWLIIRRYWQNILELTLLFHRRKKGEFILKMLQLA